MELSQQDEQIRQFMKLLEEQNRSGQAQDLSRLLFYMDGMERQFDAVLQELQAVKAQLHEEQKSPVKKALDSMVHGLEDKVSRARERILELRERLAACAASAVEGFKQAGISALDKAVSLLGIHKTLDALQQDMGGLMADTQRAIEKVETMGHELRSAGSHLKNAGRSLTGKDTRQVDGGQEGRLQAAVLAPLRTTHRIYSRMNNATLAAIGSVERLEQAATQGREKKTSIRQELQGKKAEAAARPAPAPEREKKAPEASL
jgi:hypothetical protein